MNSCRHPSLVLLPEKKNMLRCRHCHLTISADELQGGYCPECFDVHGQKNYDFEMVSTTKKEKTKYRCEQCGIIIEIK